MKVQIVGLLAVWLTIMQLTQAASLYLTESARQDASNEYNHGMAGSHHEITVCAFKRVYCSFRGLPSERPMKRSALLQPENNPEWNQLGWAWGKRSVPGDEIPRRLVRALHPVKKNPDWNDLGFAWGRK